MRPCFCEREMRSLAYRPASTNSMQEARTASLSLGLTSNAFSQARGAVAGAGDHGAVVGDREAGADAGLVVHVLRLAGAGAHLLDDLLHEVRHQHGELAAEVDAGLLLHDLDAGGPVERVVGLDERADAVLQLRDDLAAAV